MSVLHQVDAGQTDDDMIEKNEEKRAAFLPRRAARFSSVQTTRCSVLVLRSFRNLASSLKYGSIDRFRKTEAAFAAQCVELRS